MLPQSLGRDVLYEVLLSVERAHRQEQHVFPPAASGVGAGWCFRTWHQFRMARQNLGSKESHLAYRVQGCRHGHAWWTGITRLHTILFGWNGQRWILKAASPGIVNIAFLARQERVVDIIFGLDQVNRGRWCGVVIGQSIKPAQSTDW